MKDKLTQQDSKKGKKMTDPVPTPPDPVVDPVVDSVIDPVVDSVIADDGAVIDKPPQNTELQAIADAADKATGRDYEQAKQLASAYVEAHPEQFTNLQTMTIQECTNSIDVFRAAGWFDQLWATQAWILHKWPPQKIGGDYAPPAFFDTGLGV